MRALELEVLELEVLALQGFPDIEGLKEWELV